MSAWPRHGSVLERRHPVAQPDGRDDDAHRQRRAGPLPQPQVEVQIEKRRLRGRVRGAGEVEITP